MSGLGAVGEQDVNDRLAQEIQANEEVRTRPYLCLSCVRVRDERLTTVVCRWSGQHFRADQFGDRCERPAHAAGPNRGAAA